MALGVASPTMPEFLMQEHIDNSRNEVFITSHAPVDMH